MKKRKCNYLDDHDRNNVTVIETKIRKDHHLFVYNLFSPMIFLEPIRILFIVLSIVDYNDSKLKHSDNDLRI